MCVLAPGAQAAGPVYAGPPKSSSNPELHGFGELSRSSILQLALANRLIPKLFIIVLDIKGAMFHKWEDFLQLKVCMIPVYDRLAEWARLYLSPSFH